MFHVSRNPGEHGTNEVELIDAARQAIRSILPSEWSVTSNQSSAAAGSHRDYRPDAELVITARDGTTAVVLVECKGVVVPRDVDRISRQLASYGYTAIVGEGEAKGAMLVAPFVSPTTRVQLDRHGLGWFDLTGNLRLRLDRPAVFLDREGAERSGFRDPADRLLKSLRGPAAARVVLRLCETSLPVGVRDLGVQAEVGAATSARVLELLDREAVVTRDENGLVTAVDKRALVGRWARDYKVMTSNEVVATLDPRGLSHALKALSSVDKRFAVTGSAAARAYLPGDVTPVSPLVSLSVYAEDPLALMDQLGLRVVERGTNVLVLKAYDDSVYQRSRRIDGIDYAAPAQVVADLLTGPGRSSEEAEQLTVVLESNESGWER